VGAFAAGGQAEEGEGELVGRDPGGGHVGTAGARLRAVNG
jgi:hypothetical protein